MEGVYVLRLHTFWGSFEMSCFLRSSFFPLSVCAFVVGGCYFEVLLIGILMLKVIIL